MGDGREQMPAGASERGYQIVCFETISMVQGLMLSPAEMAFIDFKHENLPSI